MTKRMQVYKCEKCGNIVEVLHNGVGVLVCCNEPMKLCEEQTADASTEKHVPVIEKTDEGYIVKVGTIPHPMEVQHYIEWIELLAGNSVYRKYLKPGLAPEAEFKVEDLDNVTAKEFCSVHGLWKG